MHSFNTLSVLSFLFLLSAALAVPHQNNSPSRHYRTASGQAQIQAAVGAKVYYDPIPRMMSRRSDSGLLEGHRPVDLGSDEESNGPHRLAQEIEERYDHIDSPIVANVDSCNVGRAQCCQSLYQSQDRMAGAISSLLGLTLPTGNLMLGIQCTPLVNLLAVTGSRTCNSNPVCCTSNEYDGLINIGCSPITI